MATPKKSDRNILEQIAEQHKKFEEKHPVLATRYYVYEYRPADEDEYGSYVPDRSNLVSPYFDSVSDCNKWMDRYDPEPGTIFKVGKQNLRRFVEERWGV